MEKVQITKLEKRLERESGFELLYSLCKYYIS